MPNIPIINRSGSQLVTVHFLCSVHGSSRSCGWTKYAPLAQAYMRLCALLASYVPYWQINYKPIGSSDEVQNQIGFPHGKFDPDAVYLCVKQLDPVLKTHARCMIAIKFSMFAHLAFWRVSVRLKDRWPYNQHTAIKIDYLGSHYQPQVRLHK